jgi:AAA family ATPase
MRPGRLDRLLYVGPPDHEGRIEILKIRTKNMTVATNVDLDEIARLVTDCPFRQSRFSWLTQAFLD